MTNQQPQRVDPLVQHLSQQMAQRMHAEWISANFIPLKRLEIAAQLLAGMGRVDFCAAEIASTLAVAETLMTLAGFIRQPAPEPTASESA